MPEHSISRQVPRFATIGAVGFFIDASVLTALVNGMGMGPVLSRGISFPLAVTATWYLNRTWTFKGASPLGKGPEYARYLTVQVSGAIINLGIYLLAINLRPALGQVPIIPLAIGAAIAMIFNFIACRFWVFRPDTATAGTEFENAGSDDYTGIDNLEVMAEARNYNSFLIDLIARNTSPGTQVLDFGAGAGTFAIEIARQGRLITCLEPDATLNERLAQQHLPVVTSLGQLQDATFDSVYSLNVLEHIEDDAAALHDLLRVIKPGGTLLLYVPAFQILFSSMDRKVGHFRRYRRRPLMRLVETSGYQVDTAMYVDSLGFFAALLYRFTDRGGGEINRAALAFYDRLAFPVSRLIDRIAGRLFGKNVMLLARRPAQANDQVSGSTQA